MYVMDWANERIMVERLNDNERSNGCMNGINMPLQITWYRKWFSTRFTFVIFAASMNCLDMNGQVHLSLKSFCTNIADNYLIFIIMDIAIMFLQYVFCFENLFTNFAFQILFFHIPRQFHFKQQWNTAQMIQQIRMI